MLRGIIKTLRPHQWVKNLFVLAPMFFARDLLTSLEGQAYLNLHVTGRPSSRPWFSACSPGAVYTINDLVDVEADRRAPGQARAPHRERAACPIAVAQAIAAVLVLVSLGGAFLVDWQFFGVVALVYFAENIVYTFKA